MMLFGALRVELTALWRSRRLLAMMTRRDIAARHAGSAFGALWLYAQPVLMIAAYYVLFDVVFKMRLGENAPVRSAGAYMIAGMLPWIAFSDATGRGMMSLLEAGAMLQKNPLPLALFPARATLTTLAVYLPLMILLVLVYAGMHHFSVALLLLPVLLALMAALWYLLAYSLAILAAALRDVTQIVTFLLSIGVFMSPVMFPPSMIPAGLGWLLWFNPMTPVVLGFQALLLGGNAPEPEVWGALIVWLAVLVPVLDRLIARSREQLIDWL
jgi:lipopolysaccharide transport system permease protein